MYWIAAAATWLVGGYITAKLIKRYERTPSLRWYTTESVTAVEQLFTMLFVPMVWVIFATRTICIYAIGPLLTRVSRLLFKD